MKGRYHGSSVVSVGVLSLGNNSSQTREEAKGEGGVSERKREAT